MYPLRALLDQTYKEGNEARQAGKPVAWCMVSFWEADPILKAMDIGAVYPENYGAVCASFGAAADYVGRAEAENFPNYLCGYARNCIGYTARMRDLGEIPPEAPVGGMPEPDLLVGAGAMCDAHYKWFQALGRYLDAPSWVIELPLPGVKEHFIEGAEEHAIQFILDELKAFVDFLERLTGRKMDWDKLDEIVDDMVEINRLWHEINTLRRARPCPMHSRDFWSGMNGSLYLTGDLKATLEMYRKMYDEVKSRVDEGVGALFGEEKYRMMFIELPPWHSLSIFDRLAERGWNFVTESWAYHPPKPIDLSKVSDPLERIARFVYQWQTGYYADACKAKEWWGYQAYPSLEYARDNRCDGVLMHPILTCRTATNHLMFIKERLLSRYNIPSLVIEGDIVDLTLFDMADALRKAEAFEGVMDHYKQVRDKAGPGKG